MVSPPPGSSNSSSETNKHDVDDLFGNIRDFFERVGKSDAKNVRERHQAYIGDIDPDRLIDAILSQVETENRKFNRPPDRRRDLLRQMELYYQGEFVLQSATLTERLFWHADGTRRYTVTRKDGSMLEQVVYADRSAFDDFKTYHNAMTTGGVRGVFNILFRITLRLPWMVAGWMYDRWTRSRAR